MWKQLGVESGLGPRPNLLSTTGQLSIPPARQNWTRDGPGLSAGLGAEKGFRERLEAANCPVLCRLREMNQLPAPPPGPARDPR